jgi:hypothetical protein
MVGRNFTFYFLKKKIGTPDWEGFCGRYFCSHCQFFLLILAVGVGIRPGGVFRFLCLGGGSFGGRGY